MTKAKDLRNESIDNLEAACGDARKELFTLRGAASVDKKMEAPHRIRQARKEIARILTILHEKQAVKGNRG